jgi:hypothetical protein
MSTAWSTGTEQAQAKQTITHAARGFKNVIVSLELNSARQRVLLI